MCCQTAPVRLVIICFRLKQWKFSITALHTHGLKKLAEISDWEVAQNNLRVCLNIHSEESENCSKCWKCSRTMVELDVMGKLEQFSTFRHPLTFLDYLRWGRWIKIGYGYEKKVMQYCWQNRRDLILLVLISVGIGYFRSILLKILPKWIQQPIQQLVSPPKAEPLFTAADDVPSGGGDRL